MCVLTYLPVKNGYFITSNRDEAMARPAAIFPQVYEVNGKQLYFPKDQLGGGTWIATDGNTTVCLLNGGYKNHVRKPPYRQSRGLVVTDFFGFDTVEEFYENYFFDGIEPFTLVIFSYERGDLIEIRWTGEKADFNAFDLTQPRIWSSATLYSDEIISERESWFAKFLKAGNITAERILHFHHVGGKGDEQNDMKMNRAGNLKTVAITQFEKNNARFTIRYEDLIAEKAAKLFLDKITNLAI